MYGTTGDHVLRKPTRSAVDVQSLLGCVIGPWLIFATVCYVRSADVRYSSDSASLVICGALFVMCLWFGWMAYHTTRSDRLLTFCFISSLVAWCSAIAFGDYNFHANFAPYYDIKSLNTYPSVDPATYTGQQLMDAGEIQFIPGSHLDLAKSFGFKNGDTYCVAPVVGPKKGNATQQTYDFWAVGTNCCSGHTADFHCGEYSNRNAHKGLRFMRDDIRGYLRLAVQEAEASYNIKATHPIFMYWMEHPSDEVNAFREDGYKNLLHAVAFFLIAQFFLTVTASYLFI